MLRFVFIILFFGGSLTNVKALEACQTTCEDVGKKERLVCGQVFAGVDDPRAAKKCHQNAADKTRLCVLDCVSNSKK